MDLMSYQLGQFAIKGLLDKTGIDPKIVDYVVMGTTIQNVKTGNVAREAALTAGIPNSTPCHTVTMACISANQAIVTGANIILSGQAEVVIAGGTDPLTADQVKVITDYVDKGGDLVIFATLNVDGGVPLAAAEPLASYLYDNFGIKVENDLVVDTENSIGNEFSFQTLPADIDHFIVRDFKDTGILLFGGVHSIALNPQPPAEVTVTILASTAQTAYSKDMADTTATIEKAEGDKSGALPLVVASENSAKSSRVVIFGSIDSALNEARQYAAAGIRNTDLARNAIIWAAGYDSFRNIPSLEIVVPQPVPLFATDAQVRLVQFVAVLLLPVLILLVGGWRWWARRERERA